MGRSDTFRVLDNKDPGISGGILVELANVAIRLSRTDQNVLREINAEKRVKENYRCRSSQNAEDCLAPPSP
jgi:hypothetical protein